MKRSDIARALVLGGALLMGLPALATTAGTTAAMPAPVEAAAAVNINTADVATLSSSLKGIGQSKAQAIVDYREKNGPFKSVDELENVKGIGSKSLEKLRPMVTI